jgi:uncharacterized protein
MAYLRTSILERGRESTRDRYRKELQTAPKWLALRPVFGPRAMFDFILSLGAKKVGLNAVRPINDPDFFERPHAFRRYPEHYTNEAESTAFLLGLYDEWEKNKDANIEIREFEALHRRIDGSEARLCTLAGACIGKPFVVEPNGDFSHCDLFLGDPAYTLGNIYESGFETILQSQPIIALQELESHRQHGMSTCPTTKSAMAAAP